MDRRGFLLAAAATTATPSCALAAAKTPQMFGAVPDGVTDNTEALQKMLDAGGDIRWTPGQYLTGRLRMRDNTRVFFESGARVVGMPGQPGLLRATNVENIVLEGAGGEMFGPPGMTSHTLNLSGVRGAVVRGLKIGGGGAGGGGKDAVYVGLGGGQSRDIRIDGCTIHDARRNGISVTACFGFVIENCEIYGTTGGPGAGIDVEANRHNVIGGGVIRRNRLHGNARFGVVVAFGDDVSIHENEVFGNGATGIVVTAGSAQWNEGVYRPNVDFLPVTSIDPATGRIRVVGAENLEVGSIVLWRTREGGSRPREFARGTRFMVVDKDSRGVLLSTNGKAPITSVTPGGWGRLTDSMATTSLALRNVAEGQASNADIWRNRCHGNGGEREIEVSAGVRVRVRENEVDAGADRIAVRAVYSRRVSIVGNRLRGSTASTSKNSRGIHVGASSHIEHGGNDIRDFGYAGVFVNGGAGSYRRGEDLITNCGWLPGGAPVMISDVPD